MNDCPFCGSFNNVAVHRDEQGWVMCRSCGATGPVVPVSMVANNTTRELWRAEAIRVWRDRNPPLKAVS